MAGTPEEDLLGWLEREEEILGFSDVDDALTDIGKARQLFYDELGYNMTEEQFEGLSGAFNTRYEELPDVGVQFELQITKWGTQPTFRDTVSGRFVSKEDTFSLIAEKRKL